MSNDGKTAFLETLDKARQEGRAVAIYTEGEGFERYEVGFVDDAGNREIALRLLTTRGEPDGRRTVRTGDVARIDVDTLYLRKLETLYQFRDRVFADDFPSAPSTPGVRGQLEAARDARSVVHVVDGNDCGPVGYVRGVGEASVEIDRIGPHGEFDGRATLLLDAVAKVHVGRRQEQVAGFLHGYHDGLRKLIEG